MALDAGDLKLTLQFGKDLKDMDWFGKMDPYCVIACGSQKVRSRTHKGGGRNPVWNETFTLQVVNENEIVVTVMDEDMTSDDTIGVARIPLAKVREQLKEERLSLPVSCPKTAKQHGMIEVLVSFTPNKSLKKESKDKVETFYSAPAYPPPGFNPYAPYPPAQYPPQYPPHYPPQGPPQPYGYQQPPPHQQPPPYQQQPPPYQQQPVYQNSMSMPPQYGQPPPQYQQYNSFAAPPSGYYPNPPR